MDRAWRWESQLGVGFVGLQEKEAVIVPETENWIEIT